MLPSDVVIRYLHWPRIEFNSLTGTGLIFAPFSNSPASRKCLADNVTYHDTEKEKYFEQAWCILSACKVQLINTVHLVL